MNLPDQIQFMQNAVNREPESEINRAILQSLLTLDETIHAPNKEKIIVEMHPETFRKFNEYQNFKLFLKTLQK